MPEIHRIKTEEDFNNAIVPKGRLLQFVSLNADGTPTIKFKTPDNKFTTITAGAGEGIVSTAEYTAFEVYPTNKKIAAGTDSDVPIYGSAYSANTAYAVGDYVLCPSQEKIYTCIAALTKTDNIEPGVTEGWESYWVEGNEHFDGYYYKYTVDVPANATCKLRMYSYKKNREDCDVVIDWGDGTTTRVADTADTSVTFTDYSKSYRDVHKYSNIMIPHTYADKDCGKKYIVKIYGKDYFMLRGNNAEANNIISRMLDRDLPIASCVTNLSSFCRNSLRLLQVNVPKGYLLRSGINITYLFAGCTNLRFGLNEYCVFGMPENNCYMFNNCVNLECDISNFDYIFRAGSVINNFSYIFTNCKKLFGTIDPKVYWDNPSTLYAGKLITYDCFLGCSAAIRNQAPKAWGGTLDNSMLDKEQILIDKVIAAIPKMTQEAF